MYKILPILLFAFLVAEENQEPHFIQSDSLDFIWAQEELHETMGYCIERIGNIIDRDKFMMTFHLEIHEVMKSDTSYHDLLWTKIEEIRIKNEEYRLLYSRVDNPQYSIGALFTINIDVYVDYSIELTDYYKKTILSIINNSFPGREFEDEEIKFTSEDIHKLRNTNKQVSLNRDDIYDDSWAVIIGIDKYDNLSNLDYAVADAEAVKDMLVSKFDYKEENVKLLLNEEANRANIVNVISDVSLQAGENDRILVFYAGHGETMPLPDGGEMGYLVPIDGNQDNLLASAIPMDDLKRFSNVSKAKHMLFLVDACYGGLAAVGSRGLEPAKTPNYIEKITNIKSRQIITAGGKDEKVFEKSEWGHSAYTKNLLSALEGGFADSNEDGYITADELGDYLSEKVSIDSENQQTPQSRRLTSHEGEFIFLHSENTVAIQDKSADKEETLSDKANSSYLSKKHSITMKGTNRTELFGLGALIFEDNNTGISFSSQLNSDWTVSIAFLSKKISLLNESSQELQDVNANIAAVTLNHSLYKILEGTLWLEGMFGMAYTDIAVPNKSITLNKILPGFGVHLGMRPLPSLIPPLLLGVTILATPIPTSYNETDGIVQLDDWNIHLFPALSIGLLIPKHIIFPE